MSYNPDFDHKVPPHFIAKADQWSAFIRSWAEELQQDGPGSELHVTPDTTERMLFGLLDMVEGADDLAAFAMHCILTIGANCPSEILEFT
jgi:hypothetical protein